MTNETDRQATPEPARSLAAEPARSLAAEPARSLAAEPARSLAAEPADGAPPPPRKIASFKSVRFDQSGTTLTVSLHFTGEAEAAEFYATILQAGADGEVVLRLQLGDAQPEPVGSSVASSQTERFACNREVCRAPRPEKPPAPVPTGMTVAEARAYIGLFRTHTLPGVEHVDTNAGRIELDDMTDDEALFVAAAFLSMEVEAAGRGDVSRQ